MRLIQMVLLLTGFLMILSPRSCTRKELREDAAAVKKTRTMGGWFLAAALIAIITELIM